MLDGEVAVYDQHLRFRFDWLREPDSTAVASPPLFMAFDLLYLDSRDLTARPLRERRARLEDVVAGSELVFPVRRLAVNGLEAWEQVSARGYEGLVAKDEQSPYEGGPRRRWLKVKQRGGRSRRTAGGGGSPPVRVEQVAIGAVSQTRVASLLPRSLRDLRPAPGIP